MEGGNLKFDPTTGTITDCDTSVYSADIPEKICDVPVTKIGKNAFSGCSKLASVTIPSTVTSIGEGAFGGCSVLASIVIPDSVKSVTGVSQFNNYAFAFCSALRSVTFGSGLKSISDYAFGGCPALESLYFRGDAPGATDKMISGKLTSVLKSYYPEGAKGWTSPTWNGYITQSYALPQEEQKPQETLATATPTASTVYVNGTAVAFDADNIGGSNFKRKSIQFLVGCSPSLLLTGPSMPRLR